jgi:hypothetical protein
MNTKRLAQLPQLFRSPFLRKVALGKYHRELCERLASAGLSDLLELKLGDIFENIYEILMKYYRCEYVFKTSLLRTFFDSELSADHQSYLTDEFRVGACRVDLAIFSAVSIAFEIKTDYDSATRLPSQTSEYCKVFDFVGLVTTDKMFRKLKRAIPQDIGVLTLNEAGTFSLVRDSRSHANKTDLGAMFDCLRQKERLAIVERVCGYKGNAPNSKIYAECKRRFRQLIPFEAHAHCLEVLRNRGYPAPSVQLMLDVPNSLKYAVLMLRAPNHEMRRINDELQVVPKNTKHEPNTHNGHIFSISQGKARRTICA